MTTRRHIPTRPLLLAALAAGVAVAGLLLSHPGAEARTSVPRFGAVTVTLPATETVGMVDPAAGRWTLLDPAGNPFSFYYGNPGDVPFVGDWDCDGVDTPGLFRTSDAFAYLRNENTQGNATIRFFFGNPSDIPLAGDWNGDGCDTLSIYRPDEQRFYIVNMLGQNEGGLGAADYSFVFGNPGDKPVVGDWDGDGIDEVGLHRESTGFFYWRNTLTQGNADGAIFFGDPNDRFVAGDWGIVDGIATPAIFRPSANTFFFRHTLTQGNADSTKVFGESTFLPVAGRFGASSRTVSVSLAGAPETLRATVEEFYLHLENTPGLAVSFRTHLGAAGQQPGTFAYDGNYTAAVVANQEVAVATFDADVVLLAKFGGLWRVVGARLPSQGKTAWYGEGPNPGSPRRVMILGADDGDPNPILSRADAPHLLTARAADGKATIVDFPRTTLVQTNYGLDSIHHSMWAVPDPWPPGLWTPPPGKPSFGPGATTTAIANTIGLPIEGYILTDFTMFKAMVDAIPSAFGSALSAYLPWGSDTDGTNNCPRAGGNIGCIGPGGGIDLTGPEALIWARERTPQLSFDPSYFGLPEGGVDRVEGHAYLIRAAARKVQVTGIGSLPAQLAVLDNFIITDLTGAELLTLAATTWELPPIDLTHDLARSNDPSLPSVVLLGCAAETRTNFSPWTRPAPGYFYTLWVSGRTFFPSVGATINDVADGYLDSPNPAKRVSPDCSAHPGGPFDPGWPVD